MKTEKTAFALFFGTRGFFPASLISAARKELKNALAALGHKTLLLDAKATRFGAVETPREGKIFAKFLRRNRGKFGGVILCLPNFGDETGAVAALQDAGVPILIQAYPDTLDRMGPSHRRDAFCGKLSVMDVFHQYGVPFTALQPHTVHPESDAFARNVDTFDRVCRVVNGMRGMVVGAIGARTTPFKTVRFDELALQKHGITVETLDMSDVFARMKSVKTTTPEYKRKTTRLKKMTTWKKVPAKAVAQLARLGVVLDAIIAEYEMDALALRCWTEFQSQLGISPCVVAGDLNDCGVPVGCEVDVCNAVTMFALQKASGDAVACLDWNNNYQDHPDKCILFHCGSIPPSMMTCPGHVEEHAILATVVGERCSYGCNAGRIRPMAFTYGSMLTEDGKLKFYLGAGRFTADPIPDDYFGCAGVAHIPDLQDVLQTIGYAGHRHHVSLTPGTVIEPVRRAFTEYLNFEVTAVGKD